MINYYGEKRRKWLLVVLVQSSSTAFNLLASLNNLQKLRIHFFTIYEIVNQVRASVSFQNLRLMKIGKLPARVDGVSVCASMMYFSLFEQNFSIHICIKKLSISTDIHSTFFS